MSSDKRSVATDALSSLGTIIGEGEKRDAIHLAVEPVVAGERLEPGEHITIASGIATRVDVGMGLGIVDPFLPRAVKKGERFWFVMYPRQVHSLRHVWTHPAFSDEPATPLLIPTDDRKQNAEKRIKEICECVDIGYRDIMESAAEWLRSGSYKTQRGSQYWKDNFPPFAEEFWTLYQIVTGADVPAAQRESFFSCSC